jgi:glycosyltransferase involved in cell wall biosynthesis
MRSLRIALIGSRGIPARYGGYETLMEEISWRLRARGHQVTVYCRSHYTRRDEREHRGVELVVLPTVRTKYLDTPVHTFLACLHAAARSLRRERRFDAVLVVNAANALFVPILRLAGRPTALHVDGIERRRAKWGLPGRAVYALSERLAGWVASRLITDARVIEDHYRARYGRESTMITYGVEPQPPAIEGLLARLGLRPGGYFLYVSRFEPENNPQRVLEAYAQAPGDMPLVLVGDAPYANVLIAELRERAGRDPRVLLPGAIYGDGYKELQAGAYAYIHATEVGGTHPALVEAMGYGRCLLVNDTPENREVVGDAGWYFDAREPSTLAALCARALASPSAVAALAAQAAERARRLFSWDKVSADYERVFSDLARD